MEFLLKVSFYLLATWMMVLHQAVRIDSPGATATAAVVDFSITSAAEDSAMRPVKQVSLSSFMLYILVKSIDKTQKTRQPKRPGQARVLSKMFFLCFRLSFFFPSEYACIWIAGVRMMCLSYSSAMTRLCAVCFPVAGIRYTAVLLYVKSSLGVAVVFPSQKRKGRSKKMGIETKTKNRI